MRYHNRWVNSCSQPKQTLPSPREAALAFIFAALAGILTAIFVSPTPLGVSQKFVFAVIERVGVFFTFLGTLASGYEAFWSRRRWLWKEWANEEQKILGLLREKLGELRPTSERYLVSEELESRNPLLDSRLTMLNKFEGTVSQVTKWGVVFVGLGTSLILSV